MALWMTTPPLAKASATGRPNPSCIEGTTTAVALAISVESSPSGTKPR